jgi:polyisoprenyl-teichoic acid--peptidoglycan teichoic acid transferase
MRSAPSEPRAAGPDGSGGSGGGPGGRGPGGPGGPGGGSGGRGPAPGAPRPPVRRRDPVWAYITIVVGVLLMVFSGTAIVGGAILNARYSNSVNQDDLLPKEVSERRKEIDRDRPLNLLLVGIDARPNSTEPVRGDTIIVVHIPAGHNQAYLLSLPRDLRVEVPASPPERERAGRDRLNAAFPYGAEGGRGIKGGFQLLSRTVANLLGIRFDAGVMINFEGFQLVVRELGGVRMCLDERVVSEHNGTAPDGSWLPPDRGGEPWTFEPGCRDFNEFEALDVVRQRKSVTGGDYGRQKNQQRFLKAMLEKAKGKDVVTNPRKLDSVLRALGDTLFFDGNDISPAEWAWSLRNISEKSLVMIRTPAHGVGEGDNYLGEELDPVGEELFTAFGDGRIGEFVVNHPELINSV